MSTVAAGRRPFIAPEGAMQFEVTKGWNGEDPPSNVPQEALTFWVRTPIPYPLKSHRKSCPHKIGYPAIGESLHPWLRLHGSRDGDVVCECVGRIIE